MQRRMQLHLIRNEMAYEAPEFYEAKTDVWVFGDVAGYRYLVRRLEAASNSRKNIHLIHCSKPGNGMRVVLLPAATKPRSARLRLVERIVFLTDTPEMELVIRANRAGYQRLAAIVEDIAKCGIDNPMDHRHVDDMEDRWVVKRSVALNIRGPVRKWSKKALGDCGHFVFDRLPTFIPRGIEYLSRETWPYEEFDERTVARSVSLQS